MDDASFSSQFRHCSRDFGVAKLRIGCRECIGFGAGLFDGSKADAGAYETDCE